MGQMKKLKEIINSYERLPDGSFKESIKMDMEELKAVAKFCSKQDLNDYIYEHDQLNELEDKDVNTYKNE